MSGVRVKRWKEEEGEGSEGGREGGEGGKGEDEGVPILSDIITNPLI